jgi:glycosyltransferase involved in cell wall biosynthesis
MPHRGIAPKTMSARHLLHVFSTFEVGGQQTRFCMIANALGRKYRHSVVAMDGDFGCAERLEAGVVWERVSVAVTKNRFVSFGNIRRFGEVLGERRPDLLLTYNWGTIEWALVARSQRQTPHIHFEDGFGPGESPEVQMWRRATFRRLALGGSTQIIVPSRTLERVATEQWKLHRDRVLFLANGVDCARFAAPADPALVAPLAIPSGAFTVGTVATLRREKNLERLIEAVARLPPALGAHLVIVGDGAERAGLERAAACSAVAGRVHFTGAVRAPERIYRAFDAFAMSSDTEQMPYALLEAMAAGLPVAATDVGDIADMLPEANRALVAGRHDAAGLAEVLAVLGGDPARRAALGAGNRAHVRATYDLRLMLRRYDALFAGASDPETG